MQRHRFLKTIAVVLIVAIMAAGAAGCGGSDTDAPPASDSPAANRAAAANPGSAQVDTPAQANAPAPVNTAPITIVWYPNESSNTHEDIRAEVARLVEQATGRKAENKTTTDYTIAIQSLASGQADLAMAMGAVGYIEAKNQNPDVNVLFVNSDKNWSLDEAKYFAWICVGKDVADQYSSGGTYSIENIKGKKMSFVSNSSTSGFRVPTSSIISYFKNDNLIEDDLLPDGDFFKEVYFGQSHQGSAINLVTGNADVAAFCDIELQAYIELVSGEENAVGSVYRIAADADAPFDAHAGKEFVVIASTPVFNGPNAYNPKNLSAEEIQAILDLFTSEEVASNELLFYDADVEGAFGLYKKSSSYGYVATTDSWYDPYRG